MKNRIEMYGNKVFGVEVSEYGLEYGRLDYRTLSRMGQVGIMFLLMSNWSNNERRITMNENFKNLVDAIGSLAEIASLMRDNLVRVGFTREEAVKMAADFIIEFARSNE